MPRRPARAIPDRDRVGRAARRGPTPGQARSGTRPARADPAADLRRSGLHPVRPADGEPDVHARLPPLRVRKPDRHLKQAVQRVGRDLRGRHGRGCHGRPAHPPRRAHLAQGRQLPAQRPRPRTSACVVVDVWVAGTSNRWWDSRCTCGHSARRCRCARRRTSRSYWPVSACRWCRSAELVASQFDTVAAAAEGCDALVATGVMPAGVWL